MIRMGRVSLSLVLILWLLMAPPASLGQHWSHGWFPGGKRSVQEPPRPSYESVSPSDAPPFTPVLSRAGAECPVIADTDYPRIHLLRDVLVELMERNSQKRIYHRNEMRRNVG
ncbi:progonadoliberin-2-like isoform X2 [Lampetra planeri]